MRLCLQVAHCFPQDLVEYLQELIEILQRLPTTLNPDMRKVCRLFDRIQFSQLLMIRSDADILTGNDLVEKQEPRLPHCPAVAVLPTPALPDKELRAFLKNHIVTDIKNVNSQSKSVQRNKVRYSLSVRLLNPYLIFNDLTRSCKTSCLEC